MKKEIIVYQTKNGSLELQGDFSKETIWANIQQIADLFETDKSGISRHIRNIYESGELEQKATVAKNATVQFEGKRRVSRAIEYYNLDLILSVGYRVNSVNATKFRQWATKTLREHITKGYTLNKKVLAKNYDDFLQAVESVKKLLPSDSQFKSTDALELIKLFAGTWFSLDAYDKDELSTKGATKKTVKITGEALEKAIAALKASLIEKGDASDMFASERDKGSLAGIVGNVMQSFDKKDLYPTVEEKAAHLFYFVVKNHPFLDGNKRSGAYAFIWFLRRAGILNTARLTPTALTALTLLIAESDPRQKDKMVRLVLTLIKP